MSSQSSRGPSTRTVGRSYCRCPKPGKYGNKESCGRVQRSAREGRHNSCGMPGVLQQDTMEGPLWKETLGRRLGSHDAAERVRGMYHRSGCRQETTRLYPAQRRDGVVLSTIKYLTRHLLDPFARAKPSLLLKTHGVFERASKQNGRLTILRIDIIAGALNVFSNYQSPFEKTLLTSGTTYI